MITVMILAALVAVAITAKVPISDTWYGYDKKRHNKLKEKQLDY